MKSVRHSNNPLVILVLGLGFVLTSCADRTGTKACCESPVTQQSGGTDGFPENSLYTLESKWTNDSGAVLGLGQFGGRPQVVTMMFTSCAYACPILVHDMKRVEAALPPSLRGKVGFTLVSFDVERDTPEQLRGFRERMSLATSDWTLLRGGTEDVRELAALLGVQFRKDTKGQFAHSNILTLLDADGVVRYQQTGLNQDPDELVKQIESILRQ